MKFRLNMCELMLQKATLCNNRAYIENVRTLSYFLTILHIYGSCLLRMSLLSNNAEGPLISADYNLVSIYSRSTSTCRRLGSFRNILSSMSGVLSATFRFRLSVFTILMAGLLFVQQERSAC